MIRLDPDAFLVRQGDHPTCAYLIEEGHVEVLLEREDGDRRLAVLGPGEIVGEMALVDGAPRSASVRALDPCLLLPITAEHIQKRLATVDPILRLVLGTILDRFRATLSTLGNGPVVAPTNVASATLLKTAATAELRMQRELQAALCNGEIVVFYQPIINLETGRLAGFEALARWQHPVRGLIPPTTFVPVAEASGLSFDLTKVCLSQVASDLALFRAKAATRPGHIDPLRVAVNISGHDLTAPDFIQSLGAIVEAANLKADWITLELTETALVHSPSAAASSLAEARKIGFKVAVDDFGTGYSSLNYVRTLPLDALKIDQSFVQSMTESATTHSIVASMLKLAQALDLSVVGEGIETDAEAYALRRLGCEFGQGYLFGRPQPLAASLALIGRWQAMPFSQVPLTSVPLTFSQSA